MHSLNEFIKEKIKECFEQREEILKAFLAKYSCQPDELEQREVRFPDGSSVWRVIKIKNEENKMENKNFKVGQVWKNREGNLRSIKSIDDHHLYPINTVQGRCTLSGKSEYDIAYDLVELVKDVEDEKMKEENKDTLYTGATPYSFDPNYTPKLKLKVGKKYDILPDNCNPYIFIGNKLDLGFSSKYPYIFIDKAGCVTTLSLENLNGIKEHREPYKNIAELWIETSSHCNNQTIETYLTGLKGVIAFGKDQYINTHGGVLKKYRITTEEITENSADD